MQALSETLVVRGIEGRAREYEDVKRVLDCYSYSYKVCEEQLLRCISWILRRMHLDELNKNVQERGKAMLLTIQKNRNDSTVLIAFIHFAEEHIEDASVLRLCFRLAKHGSFTPFPAYLYLDGSFFSRVFGIMIQQKHDPVVQQCAMLFMSQFIPTDDARLIEIASGDPWFIVWLLNIMLTEEGAVAVMIQAMNMHPSYSNIQITGLDFICMLLLFDTPRVTEILLQEESFPTVILHAMKNHAITADVQKSACSLIERLVRFEAMVFGESLANAGCTKAVLAAMKNHPYNDEVQKRAISCLNRWPEFEVESVGHVMIEGGAVDLILGAMRDNSKKEWHSECIQILSYLFEMSSDLVASQIVNQGGVKTLVYALADIYTRFGFENDLMTHLARLPSSDGMLPLHYAVAWKSKQTKSRQRQIALVEFLLEAYPEATRVTDNRGRLPMHAAIEAKAPLPLIEVLLCANPASGEALYSHQNEFMNFPSALIAAGMDCNLEVIFVLFRYFPSIVQIP